MTPGTVVVLILAALVATLIDALIWSVRNPEPIDSDEWPLREET